MLEKNKVYRARVEGYTSEGLGVARIDGQAVFVHRALRGEDCDVLILKVLKNAAFGKAVRVYAPSPHRVEPDCPYYGRCGGCDFRHMEREEELYAVVLDDLRRVTHFARQKERKFAEYINRKNTAQLRQEINMLQKELDTMRRRRNELTALFKRLYEDNVLGRVTNEQFRLLSADYNAEQRELDEAIPQKEERLEKLKASAANVEAFVEKAKRYRTIDELTPQIVRLFISRIEVGERAVKHSRHSAQKIRIIYRDIGEWDYDDAVEAEQQQPQVVAVTVAQPELLPA